ncbi:MAG: hypothetical protein R3E13_11875 [Alphaproteobacteria bacterium]
MKFLSILLLAFTISSPVFAACEGFNSGMDALENAIKQTAKPVKTYKSTPPIASINRSIDALEKAIEADRRKNSAQTPRTHSPPLVTSRNIM